MLVMPQAVATVSILELTRNTQQGKWYTVRSYHKDKYIDFRCGTLRHCSVQMLLQP